MPHLYHASTIQGLHTIEPRVSTHGHAWVYAMGKPEYSLMFLGNHSDFINQIGFMGTTPCIVERFEGALAYAYKNMSGSIYTLSRDEFKSGMTTFNLEFICDHPCDVIEEKKITDALKEITRLESEHKLKIYRYPHHPSWIPADKSDLIDKAIASAKRPGSTALDIIKKFHPDIVDKVTRRLEKYTHKHAK